MRNEAEPWHRRDRIGTHTSTKGILEAADAIRESYRPFAPEAGSRQAFVTLVTKVILGTFGCLPAYDRYFVEGLRSEGLQHSALNESAIEQLFRFCQENLSVLRNEQKRIERLGGLRYPLMKLIDMYFWQIGAARAS